MDRQLYQTHGRDTQEVVYFYEHDFYVLSNFSAFQIEWQGVLFPTSEHAYQWARFGTVDQPDNGHHHQIRVLLARSAHEAFKYAQEWKSAQRKDWNEVKLAVMKDILFAKINQHEYVWNKLLQTGRRELVEDSWRDTFWGAGEDGTGLNMLGRMWMEVRDAIQIVGEKP